MVLLTAMHQITFLELKLEKEYLGANPYSRCLRIRSDDRVWCTSSWDSGTSSCLCAGSGLSNRVGLPGTTRWGFLITHDGHNMLLVNVKPCLPALMYFDWLQRAWNLLVQTGQKWGEVSTGSWGYWQESEHFGMVNICFNNTKSQVVWVRLRVVEGCCCTPTLLTAKGRLLHLLGRHVSSKNHKKIQRFPLEKKKSCEPF